MMYVGVWVYRIVNYIGGGRLWGCRWDLLESGKVMMEVTKLGKTGHVMGSHKSNGNDRRIKSRQSRNSVPPKVLSLPKAFKRGSSSHNYLPRLNCRP